MLRFLRREECKVTVEFISVGTEILLGNIVNTNAAYLSEKCAGLGLSCYHQSVVGDNEKRLEDALRLALSRSDIVILGGGLGPTKDDLTKEVTAKVFGKELYEDALLDPHDIVQKYIDIAFADLNDYLEYGQEEVPVIIKNPITGEDEVLKQTVNMVKFKESAFADGTILSEVKQGRNGASIKLADRMKALDWLSKHMNITTEEQKLKIEVLKKQLNTNDQEDDGVEIINDAPI